MQLQLTLSMPIAGSLLNWESFAALFIIPGRFNRLPANVQNVQNVQMCKTRNISNATQCWFSFTQLQSPKKLQNVKSCINHVAKWPAADTAVSTLLNWFDFSNSNLPVLTFAWSKVEINPCEVGKRSFWNWKFPTLQHSAVHCNCYQD